MKLICTILLSCLALFGQAQSIYIENDVNPDEMVMDFFDSDSLDISNFTFNGANVALGFFDADTLLDVGAGLVFSTGDIFTLPFPASEFAGSNNEGIFEETDPDIFTAVDGVADNFDRVSIEFDVVSPESKELTFNYIFGSEEYPEFVNSNFNDAFLFLVSGPGIEGPYSNNAKNIAMIPDSEDPVAINNLNAEMNADYYVDNETSQYLILDAHTTVLPASFEVLANETYHVKIVIADVADATYDSGIFLGYNSLGNQDNLVPPTVFSLLQNGSEISIENDSKYAVEYNWDFGNGQTSLEKYPSNVNFQTPGDYEVTLSTKNYCCTNSFKTIVSVPMNALSISTNIQQEVLCYGENSGIINVFVSGGNGPYTYTSEPVADFGMMSAGDYVIIVTDQDGQTAAQAITITEPEPLSVTGIISPSMDNGANGSVEANPDGGTIPYTFLWSNNETTQIIENLIPGDYAVTVTDNNGCQSVNSYNVTSINSALSGTATVLQNVSCFQGNDGEISFGAAGGNPPYSFTTTPEVSDFEMLTAGDYSFVIIDQDGQQVDGQFTITEPTDLELLTSSMPSDENMENGSATVDVDGGTAPYNYLWSTGDTTPSIDGLAPDTYSVEVTDANGCIKFVEVIVEMLVNVHGFKFEALEIYPNPSSDMIILKNLSASIKSMIFTNSEGRKIDMSANVSSNTVAISSLPAGIYIIEMEDTSNKLFSGEVIIIK